MGSKALTRAELVDAIHRQAGIDRAHSGRLLARVLDLIAEALDIGEPVLLSGFGRFVAREKSERAGRNPMTLAEAKIEARRSVSFRASGVIKDRIDQGFARRSVASNQRRGPGRQVGERA